MIDLEERLRGELDRLLPLPRDAEASWEDALRRAEVKPDVTRNPVLTRRRIAVLALTVATVALLSVITPVGGAIVRGFGDFSAWLTGSPGEPASESAYAPTHLLASRG